MLSTAFRRGTSYFYGKVSTSQVVSGLNFTFNGVF